MTTTLNAFQARPTSPPLKRGMRAAGLASICLATMTGAGASQDLLHTFEAGTFGGQFGETVSGAGDVDGDGFDDLIVGAPYDDVNVPDSGSVWVYSGATGAQLLAVHGTRQGEHLGKSVDTAGDIDGDGFADIVFGAENGYDDPLFGQPVGYAVVMSPRTGATLHKWFGVSIHTMFGSRVAHAGDVDGDSVSDIVVGAYQQSTNTVYQAGAVWIFSGATGAAIRVHEGAANGDFFGWDVDAAGDVDQDGFADVIVGAPLNDAAGNNAGSATVYSGATGAIIHSWNGDKAEDQFGEAVAVAGDVDGDGSAELLVGAPFADINGTLKLGSARLYCGDTGSALVTFVGDTSGCQFGTSVAALGDLDGDGFAEFIVGAPKTHHSGVGNNGLARVFSGGTLTALFTVLGLAVPGQDGDELGEAVAGVGDTNGDGILDFIVGAGQEFARVYSGPGNCSVVSTSYCTAGTSTSGCHAVIALAGTPSATASSGFLLIASGVEGAKDGLFYFGTNGRQANSWGNGTSFQCVAPPVLRAGLLAGSGTVGSCDGSYSQDMNARWTSKPAQNPGAGAAVQAQLWYRDPQNSSNQTTSLSDAIEFLICP